jgi:hypothetical protein
MILILNEELWMMDDQGEEGQNSETLKSELFIIQDCIPV